MNEMEREIVEAATEYARLMEARMKRDEERLRIQREMAKLAKDDEAYSPEFLALEHQDMRLGMVVTNFEDVSKRIIRAVKSYQKKSLPVSILPPESVLDLGQLAEENSKLRELCQLGLNTIRDQEFNNHHGGPGFSCDVIDEFAKMGIV